jgi:hypothetical protein
MLTIFFFFEKKDLTFDQYTNIVAPATAIAATKA